MFNTIQMKLGQVDIVGAESLGQVGYFQDKDLTTAPASPTLNSQMFTKAVLVLNDTGGTLAAGTGCTFKSGYLGLRVGAKSGANLVCDGIVDPDVSAAVPDQAYFWLIIGGPTRALIGAGDQTANGVVQTLASGLFGTGTAGTNPIGHCGKANAAGTSGNLCRILFNNPFSALRG